MLQFFHGWRRKAGSVALVMACVFLGGWMRSTWIHDHIVVYRKNAFLRLVSTDGSFGWIDRQPFDTSELKTLPPPYWATVLADAPDAIKNPLIKWQLRLLGFAIGQGPFDEEIVLIPYWSLVLPLTFLSAYLILRKPQMGKPADQTTSPNVNSN